jgi:ribosome-associated toxin RatA of RatAB toxin-antitoxin module
VETIKAVLHYPTISHNFFSAVSGTSMYTQFLTMSVKVTVTDERPSSRKLNSTLSPMGRAFTTQDFSYLMEQMTSS